MTLRSTVLTLSTLLVSSLPLTAQALPFSLQNTLNPGAVNAVKQQSLSKPDIQATSITITRLDSTRLRVTGVIRNIGADQASHLNQHQVALSYPGLPVVYRSIDHGLRRGESVTLSMDVIDSQVSSDPPLAFSLAYTPEPDTASAYDSNFHNNLLQQLAASRY